MSARDIEDQFALNSMEEPTSPSNFVPKSPRRALSCDSGGGGGGGSFFDTPSPVPVFAIGASVPCDDVVAPATPVPVMAPTPAPAFAPTPASASAGASLANWLIGRK